MNELKDLYYKYTGIQPDEIIPLPQSASKRNYFRLRSGEKSMIGTFCPDVNESRAFVEFSRHFRKKGVRVPEIFIVSDDYEYYLQEDMGDDLLFDRMKNAGFDISADSELLGYYKKALKELVKIQFEGGEGLDYSLCVPRSSFDQQAIMWDLNHFKYYFLKLSEISFDEDLLEDDFKKLSLYLSEKSMNHFMFRDFQSRNIIIFENKIHLIDYQGGRRGPIHYDLASLLYEAKTMLPEKVRLELLNEYMKYVSEYEDLEPSEFIREFYWWALIRVLQAIGAYGLRGTIEKKAVFLQSIPEGLKNLGYILNHLEGGPKIPELKTSLLKLVATGQHYPSAPDAWDGLTISLTSFSFRKTYPDDLAGNGGGFVYDCRFLPNPGRFEKYRELTGFDLEIEEFFQEKEEMEDFLNDVKTQLTKVVDSYLDLGYNHLSVSFGCTGGRHRSVFAMRRISEFLMRIKNVRIIENHRELSGRP